MSVSTYAEIRAETLQAQRCWRTSNTIPAQCEHSRCAFVAHTVLKDQEQGQLEVVVAQSDVTAIEVDVLVVNLFEGVTKPGGATGAVDSALGGVITELIADGEITGSASELTLIHTPNNAYPNFSPSRVLVVGLGSSDSFDTDGIRRVSASVIRKLRSSGVKHAATIVHGAGIGGLETSSATQATVEGSLLGSYRFLKYRTTDKKRKPDVGKLTIVEADSAKIDEIKTGIERGVAYSQAEILARNLVNEPANKLAPADLAATAQSVANENGLDCIVLEEADVTKLGMGAYVGVSQGGPRPLKFIHMTYAGDSANSENNLWLIGKGITFDSGGISIKPGAGMGKMKGDMGGGASVIAAIQAIAQLKPKLNVHVVCAATDNMPGGSAQRPGDVVTAMNGMTIEVDNTDAEGRLTLADAIGYAKSKGAERIVDVATLTGAARVALGDGVSPLFGNDEELVSSVLETSSKVGEPMWRLPLDSVTKRQNASKIADLKNTGGRGGGSTTAAHFIADFAGDTPWVHIDVAATSMLDSTRGWMPAGATGVPTRSLIELAMSLGG